MLYCLFGAALAGLRDWQAALAASIVTGLVLLAAHFRNNYRDVELGIDRYVESSERAERIISTIKPYTAAAWLVPLRITSTRFQRVNEAASLALSAILYALLVFPKQPLTLPVFLLGVFFAESYTDLWKRRGLGEVACFMGHGYLSVLFGYLTQAVDQRALLAGLVPGLVSGLIYSVDQYVDLRSDFVVRVRSLAEVWFKSELPLSLYVLVVYTLFIATTHILVTAGIYPRGVLVVLATLPLVLVNAPRLEYNRDKALRDMVLTMVSLVPLLMLLGVLLNP
jgi:1,4-dihydroxy-2-naphthoate octaprenyltransferase